MKANELMIGDYVYNHRNWECTIVEIHKDSAVVIARHYGEEECLLSDLRPIPLTSGILEKNFESESNIFGLQTYNLNENFYLEDRGERFCLVRKCQYYNSSIFWICDLTYLHQLQHALRFCGIEKEIIL